MKLVINSNIAGQSIRSIHRNSASIQDGRLILPGIKTSRIAKVTAGYADIVFETASGSHYMLSLEGEDDIFAPVIDTLFELSRRDAVFAALASSPLGLRYAESFNERRCCV